jgi:hypothetical protein
MPTTAQRRLWGFYCGVMFLSAFMPCAQAWDYTGGALRFKINAYLVGVWDGTLNIDEVAFDPAGSIEMRNVSLGDQKGRNWFEMKFARAMFTSDQNGLKVKELRLEQPHLTMWFDKGQLNWPLLGPSLGLEELLTTNARYVKQLIIRDAAVTLAEEHFNVTWDGLAFEATQTADTSKFLFELTRDRPQSSIYAAGEADMSTQQINVDFKASHTLGENETHGIFTLFDVPLVHDANALLTANLRFTGNFNDSATLWPAGYVIIRNGIVNGSEGRLLEDLKSRITFADKGFVSFDVIHATALSGRFFGVGFLAMRADDSAWFGGHVRAEDVNLAQFSKAVGGADFLTKGTASGRYDFTATSRDIREHKGQGIIFLDDSDVWKMPVVSQMFKFLGSPLTYSDGLASFKFEGPSIIFNRAGVTSPWTAIEFQTGSYVNLQEQFVDAYAVFVPLRKLRDITNMIPFFHIFTNLSANLTRVRIRGSWSDPPSRLIRKEVLTDVRHSTITFFSDVARSGGQIGTEITGRVRPLFATPSSSEISLDDNP